MKRNKAWWVLGLFALSLSIYTDAQQPATFHGEISDSQCILRKATIHRIAGVFLFQTQRFPA